MIIQDPSSPPPTIIIPDDASGSNGKNPVQGVKGPEAKESRITLHFLLRIPFRISHVLHPYINRLVEVRRTPNNLRHPEDSIVLLMLTIIGWPTLGKTIICTFHAGY